MHPCRCATESQKPVKVAAAQAGPYCPAKRTASSALIISDVQWLAWRLVASLCGYDGGGVDCQCKRSSVRSPRSRYRCASRMSCAFFHRRPSSLSDDSTGIRLFESVGLGDRDLPQVQ